MKLAKLIGPSVQSGVDPMSNFKESVEIMKSRSEDFDSIIKYAEAMAMKQFLVEKKDKKPDNWKSRYHFLDLECRILHIHERGIDVSVLYLFDGSGEHVGRYNWSWEEIIAHREQVEKMTLHEIVNFWFDEKEIRRV